MNLEKLIVDYQLQIEPNSFENLKITEWAIISHLGDSHWSFGNTLNRTIKTWAKDNKIDIKKYTL